MINCKSQAELDKMRRSGHIVRQVLETVTALVGPGVSTMDLTATAGVSLPSGPGTLCVTSTMYSLAPMPS